MATSQSVSFAKTPAAGHSTSVQAFENLAKKLHRLESRAGMVYL